jgi:hypothetical protein
MPTLQAERPSVRDSTEYQTQSQGRSRSQSRSSDSEAQRRNRSRRRDRSQSRSRPEDDSDYPRLYPSSNDSAAIDTLQSILTDLGKIPDRSPGSGSGHTSRSARSGTSTKDELKDMYLRVNTSFQQLRATETYNPRTSPVGSQSSESINILGSAVTVYRRGLWPSELLRSLWRDIIDVIMDEDKVTGKTLLELWTDVSVHVKVTRSMETCPEEEEKIRQATRILQDAVDDCWDEIHPVQSSKLSRSEERDRHRERDRGRSSKDERSGTGYGRRRDSGGGNGTTSRRRSRTRSRCALVRFALSTLASELQKMALH